MDVRCERCSTEYEFDDALVSGRGTTVKCTNCGHKFKIRRSDGDFSEDFWNVRTADGRTLIFTSLRELQRAIQTRLVERDALLSRGGLKHKAIGQIPELLPFFEMRDQPQVSQSRAPAASTGAAQTRSSRPPPPPGVSAVPLAPPPRQRMSTRDDFPPPVAAEQAPAAPSFVSSKRTLSGTGSEPLLPVSSLRSGPPSPSEVVHTAAGAPNAERPQPAFVQLAPSSGSLPVVTTGPVSSGPAQSRRSEPAPPTERDAEPDTERFGDEPRPSLAPASAPRAQPLEAPPVASRPGTPAPPPFEASSPLAPPVAAPAPRPSSPRDEGARSHPPPPRSESPPSMTGGRRSVGGFVVAGAVAAGVVLVGALWAKDHLRGALGGRPPPAVATDPRVASLLEGGERALAEGDLEAAKERFDKASALAERDPRLLLDAARLAAVRADAPWLRSRLLPSDGVDEQRLAASEVGERSSVARRAADEALALAPDDPAALRVKIDALRIAGDRAGARALVARIAATASQPETAYVLAALDLAESEPLWSTVIERLRVAAGAEAGPGRGRAALAYALARSGDVAGAKVEVERLAGMPRQHPLLPLLRSFAQHARPILRVADPMSLDGGLAATDGGRRLPGDKGARPPGDARQLVTQGEAARAEGDYERAQSLFAAALDRNPSDAEALSGLAAIAHARRDLNGARASYKRVLSVNPSYVPALVGVGDVDWESGDRASAMKTYKEIVERFPEGSYPARVRQRVEGAAPAPAPSVAPAASVAPTSPEPAPSDPGGGG
jgi:predicted Zn finger-like uncharacterized protein